MDPPKSAPAKCYRHVDMYQDFAQFINCCTCRPARGFKTRHIPDKPTYCTMRIFAKVTGGENGKGETLVVACTDTSRPVSSIVEELKAREEVSGVGERYQLRLAEN